MARAPVTTMIGGGLGPFVIGGIIDGGVESGDLATLFGLCVFIGVIMLFVYRKLRY